MQIIVKIKYLLSAGSGRTTETEPACKTNGFSGISGFKLANLF
jgi:hypothetical protein